MEKEKIGFFQEAPNVNSWTRAAATVLGLFFLFVNAFWLLDNETHVTESFMKFLDIVLLVAIFTPKSIQKFVEFKLGLKPKK